MEVLLTGQNVFAFRTNMRSATLNAANGKEYKQYILNIPIRICRTAFTEPTTELRDVMFITDNIVHHVPKLTVTRLTSGKYTRCRTYIPTYLGNQLEGKDVVVVGFVGGAPSTTIPFSKTYASVIVFRARARSVMNSVVLSVPAKYSRYIDSGLDVEVDVIDDSGKIVTAFGRTYVRLRENDKVFYMVKFPRTISTVKDFVGKDVLAVLKVPLDLQRRELIDGTETHKNQKIINSV